MVFGPERRAGDRPHEPPVEACRRQEKDQWVCRRLLERQLHDGAALRISALTLRLGLVRHDAPPGQAAFQVCLGELQDELHAVLEELRDVAGKLYPPLLDQAGLGPALREVADRMGRPVVIVASGERFGVAAEGAAYFAVAECLASLPAGAPAVEVVVRKETDELMLSVLGVDARHAHLVDDRARPLGGTVDVVDGHGPGASTITARIPCE
ncbi:MAG: histidine kinase [Pseudonocardiales bacterium]|nr:histidine kinase [Pseudonocardiales bacterium]